MWEEHWSNDLSNVKVGDWIATTSAGWAKVVSITPSSKYPICTEKNRYTRYTIDGKVWQKDVAPVAFTIPPEWLSPFIGPKPCEFEPDEVILVSHNSMDWYMRHFVSKEGQCYKCVCDGRSLKTQQGSYDAKNWPLAKKLEED